MGRFSLFCWVHLAFQSRQCVMRCPLTSELSRVVSSLRESRYEAHSVKCDWDFFVLISILMLLVSRFIHFYLNVKLGVSMRCYIVGINISKANVCWWPRDVLSWLKFPLHTNWPPASCWTVFVHWCISTKLADPASKWDGKRTLLESYVKRDTFYEHPNSGRNECNTLWFFCVLFIIWM